MLRSLVRSIKLSLDPFHRERVHLIDNFDYSSVIAKVRRDRLERELPARDEYLRDGVEALKQYYVVALLDPKNYHAVSTRVDPFWHSHILHTQDYHRFCAAVFGQYIHHTPLDESDGQQVAVVDELYRYTYGIYQKMFCDIDDYWWPHPDLKPLICTHYPVTAHEVEARALFDVTPVTERCLALA